ncbi:DUF2645 family protein [Pseudocitrobacter vendiensis]|uniref:DUF2645 family protein n=1 Tax=Pseudocitrobacter vendiensis TaxID=2488306 RepID=A0ABM9FDW4_9ENTR|nr:DUF2645 family protein [Pseudocitrobacter vendiensis]CAH6661414.1 hypothetical protein FBBNIHIM_20100 [Pseudocitrobacter vendiensis]
MRNSHFKDIFEAVIYVLFSYWIANKLFSINKYSWMLSEGDNLCGIPHVSNDSRLLQYCVFLFFFATPVVVIIFRYVYLRRFFNLFIYIFVLLSIIFNGWWLFWGRYDYC